MHRSRDAAPIIADGDRAIGIQRDCYEIRKPCQSLVNGVVNDLVHHVVKARAVIRIADIHSGAFADSIEAFQDLDRLGAIGGFGFGATGSFSHYGCFRSTERNVLIRLHFSITDDKKIHPLNGSKNTYSKENEPLIDGCRSSDLRAGATFSVSRSKSPFQREQVPSRD
ncbi:MAG: hypothetical protein RL543_1172 [Pseudomonadota bacterium]